MSTVLFFEIPNVQFEDSMVFKNYVFLKKNSSFNTKFRVFSKIPHVQKIPRSRDGVLTQNSVFFQNFRTFKKFPVRETEF